MLNDKFFSAAKKRAAWDVSGRLADLEVRMTDQIEKNDHLNSRIEELEAQKRHLEGAVVQKEEQTTAVSLEVEQLRKALRFVIATIFEEFYAVGIHVNVLV